MNGPPPPTGSSTRVPTSSASAPAGWYPDPTGATTWRWWNGHAWTNFVGGATERRKPRLPRWSSVPVAVFLPLVALGIAVMAVVQPLSVVLGLVPLAIVLPVLAWLDRVEPEPRASKVHAVLWGASVAVSVSVVVNTVVAVVAGEIASMVVSAPLIEEASKAAGIVWAVRRREVDGVSDGIVYAGWIALGFAVVEDMTYFATASVQGALLPVFVIRALLTPFAHPLFTFWIGLAIGRAVQNGRSIWPAAAWGYAVAVALHALWNGSLAIGEIRPDVTEDVALTVVLLVAGLFVLLFVAVAVALVRARRDEQRRFEAMSAFLVARYDLTPDEAAWFRDWGSLLRARAALPRRSRRRFDEVHAALARLSLLHRRMNDVDPVTEQLVAAELRRARAALAERA